MSTGYCIYCGNDFTDGNSAVDRGDGTLHRDCVLTEQAMDATWPDVMEEDR